MATQPSLKPEHRHVRVHTSESWLDVCPPPPRYGPIVARAWLIGLTAFAGGGLAQADVLDDLEAQLDSPDYQVRMLSCRQARALGIAGVPDGATKEVRVVDYLYRALGDRSENVVREALAAATEFPIEPVFDRVLVFANGTRCCYSSMTRAVAVQALGRLGRQIHPTGSAAVMPLADLLSADLSIMVRFAAALALGSLANPLAEDPLDAALGAEADLRVLAAINRALQRLRRAIAASP